MRIHSANLGLFVPGRFVVPENPIMRGQGRRGTGDFVPGWFAVPQNPVGRNKRGTGDFVPGCYALPQNPVSDAGMNGLGDDVPTSAMYPIPQNSVLAYWESGGISNEGGLTGLGCGCGGKCGCSDGCGSGMSGLGQTTTSDSISVQLQQVSADFSNAIANPTILSNWTPLLTDPIWLIPVWGYIAGAVVLIAVSSSGGGKRRR